MSLAEKYAIAEFNAVKSHERRIGAAKKEAELLETATQNCMKQQPELSREEALDKAKALLGIK